MRLCLYFTPSQPPALEEISFERPGHEMRLASRGKSPFRGDSSGRFQWSSAVKAFALLIAGSKLALIERHREPFTLAGEDNSAAASLDYAISKPTQWILDIFGSDSDNRPVATRVITRFNSERKRPGPVKLTLASALLSPGALTILVGQKELADAQSLRALIETLNPDTLKTPLKISPDRSASTDWRASGWFAQAVEEELTASLREVQLLDPLGLSDALERQLPHCSPTEKVLVNQIGNCISSHLIPEAIRHRPLSESFLFPLRERNVRALCPPFACGAIALMRGLSTLHQLPVSVDWSFPGTSAILNCLDQESGTDALVLSWSAALKLLEVDTDHLFQPMAFLPRSRLDLIYPQYQEQRCSSVYLATENSSYPARYLQLLKESGVNEALVLSEHQATLSECVTHLSRQDGAAVLAFPLSLVVSHLTRGSIFISPQVSPRMGDNILMLRRTPDSQWHKPFVRVLITCWYGLLEHEASRRALTQDLLHNTPYTTLLQRLGGLYSA